jgi:hypothetical protein
VTRAGVGGPPGGLRRLERLVPAPKKISLSKRRNNFIPTFTQLHYALLLQKVIMHMFRYNFSSCERHSLQI